MNLSGVAVSGHRGVRVGEGFLDPTEVFRETFPSALFYAGTHQSGSLLEARFVTSVVYLRTGVSKRGDILAATFPTPAVDISPSPALSTAMQLGETCVFRKGDVDELAGVGPFCDKPAGFS